ncbi:hypothetical protein B0H12DRAFT_524164 [Mycena haematopus]|nr:hypothetical protein B0H12DRAFT_524164 [Mycena haematopus]
MPQQSPPDLTLTLLTKRRRVNLACVHCRRRKVKCITSDVPPSTPCERCKKMGLSCTYISVAAQSTDWKSPTAGRKPEHLHRLLSTPPPTTTRPYTWNQLREHHNLIGAAPGSFDQQPPVTKDEVRPSFEIRLLPPAFERDISLDTPNSIGTTPWSFHTPLSQTMAHHRLQSPAQEYTLDYHRYLPEFAVQPGHIPYPPDAYRAHACSVHEGVAFSHIQACMCPLADCKKDFLRGV